MYDIMVRHPVQLESSKRGDRQGQYRGDNQKAAFSQNGVQQDQEERENLVPVTTGATRNVICYNCNKYGLRTYNLPEPDRP